MEINEMKRKTNTACGIVAAISSIVAVVFLITPKAPLLLGLVAVTACSFGAGFGVGLGYYERLQEKDEKNQKDKML